MRETIYPVSIAPLLGKPRQNAHLNGWWQIHKLPSFIWSMWHSSSEYWISNPEVKSDKLATVISCLCIIELPYSFELISTDTFQTHEWSWPTPSVRENGECWATWICPVTHTVLNQEHMSESRYINCTLYSLSSSEVVANLRPKFVSGKMSHERTGVVTLMLNHPGSPTMALATSVSLLWGKGKWGEEGICCQHWGVVACMI